MDYSQAIPGTEASEAGGPAPKLTNLAVDRMLQFLSCGPFHRAAQDLASPE